MDDITVESVQVGALREVGSGRRAVGRSGIDKRPVPAIHLRTAGIIGDAIAHPEHHGGAGQAVYAYSRQDYAVFEAQLGVSLAAGTFGENVTISAFPADVRIGDRFVADSGAVLEVSGPRVPCQTFAARMSEVVGEQAATGWVKRFTAERRPGWYCRVVVEGELAAGTRLTVERGPAEHLLGMQLWDLLHTSERDPALVARGVTSPVDERIRSWLEELAATSTA